MKNVRADPKKPLVPYFVSFTLHEYTMLDPTSEERSTANALIAFVDFFMHAGAWAAAFVIGIVLTYYEQDEMHAIAKLLLQGSFSTLVIAAAHVILIWAFDSCLAAVQVGLLPPSMVAAITGMARASVVFAGLAVVALTTAAIESGVAPTGRTLHQLRLLCAMLGLELFGLAATLNNHRVELGATTVSAS